LVLLVVGMPVGLAAGVGWPLPHGLPTLHELTHALTTRTIPDGFVPKVLAVVVWVAWFDLMLCVFTEVAAALRGGVAAHVPFGGAFQPLVGRLLATAVLTFTLGGARPALAAPMPLAHVLAQTTTTTALAAPPPIASVAPVAPAPAASVTYVVVPGDNLWDIAHAQLGDATRWPEIYELNQGRHQSDGRWLRKPDLIRPGWNLALPAGAANPVVAAPAPAPAPPAPEPPEPQPVVPAATSPADASVLPSVAAAPAPDVQLAEVPPPITEVPPVPTAEAPPPVTAAPPPAPEVPAPRRTVTRPRRVDRGPARVKLPGGGNLLQAGLLGAGVVGVLDRLRRVRQRRRLPGQRLAPVSPELGGRELALRVAADFDGASFLDLALRALAAGLRAEGIEAPEVVAAILAADQLELVLATPAQEAPTGFMVADGGSRWLIPRPERLSELADLGMSAACPLPALVTAGHTDAGAQILVDLEETGLVSICGSTRVAHEVLSALATELATRHDDQEVAVVLVGFGKHLGGLEHVRTVESLDAVLDDLETTADQFGQRLLERGSASMFDARIAGDRSDPWVPTVVLCWQPPAGRVASRLASLTTRAERAGVVAVVAGAMEGAPWRFDITSEGVDISPLGLFVHPHRLNSRETGAIGDLIGAALHVDDVWAPEAAPDPEPEFEEVEVDELEFDEPVPEFEVELGADEAQAHVTSGDDDDLAVDLRHDDHGVEVRILGPIDIVGGAELLTRTKSIELVVHLAMHRRSIIDADRLVEALWPGHPLSGRTLNTTMSVARKALGRADDGAAHLPTVKPGGYGEYRIGDAVRLDYDRFTELVAQARSEDPADARATLHAALELVRGRPFEAIAKGYEWAHVEGLVAGIEAEVADAAHALAQLCLDAGDAEGARWAAQQGLRASQGHEQLYRDQMYAANLNGTLAGVESVWKELAHMVEDDDPVDSLHPETVAVYKQLTHSAG
jgi:DNA-binding SARP family transcriptional activator/LysM repeat protein